MTYAEAIKKLNKLLGLSYKFKSYKVKDSEEELVVDGDLMVGEPIYTITENGQLPAPDMTVELQDSTQLQVEEGKIKKITYDMEKKESFVEATLDNGVVVKSPTFDVGEEVFVVGSDGSESPAPDGEHQLMLKDSEGNEVKIRIITKDGKIVERMNVEEQTKEEEMADLSSANGYDDDFKKVMMEKMENIISVLDNLVTDYEDMKSKVSKFAKEPAGSPIHQPKNLIKDYNNSKFDQFTKILELRNKK